MKLAEGELQETNKNISARLYHPLIHPIFEPRSRLTGKTEIVIY